MDKKIIYGMLGFFVASIIVNTIILCALQSNTNKKIDELEKKVNSYDSYFSAILNDVESDEIIEEYDNNYNDTYKRNPSEETGIIDEILDGE